MQKAHKLSSIRSMRLQKGKPFEFDRLIKFLRIQRLGTFCLTFRSSSLPAVKNRVIIYVLLDDLGAFNALLNPNL